MADDTETIAHILPVIQPGRSEPSWLYKPRYVRDRIVRLVTVSTCPKLRIIDARIQVLPNV